MCESSLNSDLGDLDLENFQCPWHRRAVSLELTEKYLTERLQVKERQLETILKSPAWKISKPLRILNLIAWKMKPVLSREETISSTQGIRTSGPTVVEQVSPYTVVTKVATHITKSEKLAVLATWLKEGTLSYSTQIQIDQLSSLNFEVILVCVTPEGTKAQLPSSVLKSSTVIFKPNLGYDFGSWAVALKSVNNHDYEEVLLLNDSSILLDADFLNLIARAQSSPYDITSVTDSQLHSYHLQSYFLHFKNGSFAHPAVQDLLLNVRDQSTKEAIIFAYELGLSRIARDAKFLTGSLFPWNAIRSHSGNPSVEAWKELISMGSPLIKCEAIRAMKEKEFQELLELVRAGSKHGEDLAKDLHKARAT